MPGLVIPLPSVKAKSLRWAGRWAVGERVRGSGWPMGDVGSDLMGRECAGAHLYTGALRQTATKLALSSVSCQLRGWPRRWRPHTANRRVAIVWKKCHKQGR
jgi:hypothetical protein